MKDTLRRSYDKSAPSYDGRFRALQRVKYDGLLGPAADVLQPALASGLPILDLGCGTGLLAEHLEGLGLPTRPLVGIDLSLHMTRRAFARGLRCAQADLERLPFRSGTFAAVLAFTSLGIFPGPCGHALAETARVLQAGGLFCVSVLQRGLSPGFPAELEASGFAPGPRALCGQDAGWVCLKR